MEFGMTTDLECRNCGSSFEFTERPRPDESTDREYCDRCGRELMQWYGERCCEMKLLPRNSETA